MLSIDLDHEKGNKGSRGGREGEKEDNREGGKKVEKKNLFIQSISGAKVTSGIHILCRITLS